MKRISLALLVMILPLTVLNCTQYESSPTMSATQNELAVCGDQACTPNVEDCGTCPGDCPCPGGFVCSNRQCVPVCGDGSCAPGVEDCGNCPIDCPCFGGATCQNHQCVSDPCNGDPCCGDPCCGDICCRRPQLCCNVPAAEGGTKLVICPL
jgi:hypothetical protein